ncbi:MAG: tail fiber domain-containing protein [Thermoanaerobaculia bacterium]|nr:tail fiber domain-containing protein [Thermoanaerobaculia bacterium]
MRQSLTQAVGIAAIAVLLLAVPSLAATAGAEAALSGDVLTWSLAGDNNGATLRISGQGIVVEQTFARGATPTQSAFDNSGNALPDGNYTWEVRALAAPMSAADQAAIRHNQEGQPVDRNDNFRGEVISGAFTILNGSIVDPGLVEAVGAPEAASTGSGIQNTTEGAVTNVALADFVINDDLIVDGSACIGFDCINGEVFGFDTIRLKENNVRIKFDDTSNSGAFPNRDWQLTANDSSNGGANKFSIEDISGGRTPFTIEAAAPSHSLYVDDGGRVGLGTSTPVVELHVVNGDSPTLRLEQDGSSGFTAQTWDLAGNETNFFVRDATNGSQLPFRIRPSAPTNSIYVNTNGDVGMGTASPKAPLHVISGGTVPGTVNAATQLLVQNTAATTDGAIVTVMAGTAGNSQIFFGDPDNELAGRFTYAHGSDTMRLFTNGGERVRIDATGQVGFNTTTLSHPLTVGTGGTNGNGAHLTAGGVWTNGSSRDFKNHIVGLETAEAMTTLQGLTPVRYQYNVEPGEEYVGFIAEDVPELVASSTRKHLASMDIVAVLTKVVQEQQKTIEALAARLENLETPKE